eukprot:Gb_05304 [translate_table: standard]
MATSSSFAALTAPVEVVLLLLIISCLHFPAQAAATAKDQSSGRVHKYGLWGGLGGLYWKDGVFSAIKSIAMTTDSDLGFRSIQVDYDTRHNTTVSGSRHGGFGETNHTIQFKHPGEILTKISGYYGIINTYLVIRSLEFETNKAKYGPFGAEEGTAFESPSKGNMKIVGFYGRAPPDIANGFVDAIGIYTLTN